MMKTPTPKVLIDLDSAWIYKLSVLSRLVEGRVSLALQQIEGINLSKWRVLAAIADTPGRISSEVVAVTPMDKGLVSRAVSALVADGLIRREACEGDRRASSLFLTETGAVVYDDIFTAITAADADGAQCLSPCLTRDLLASLEAAITGFQAKSQG